MLIVSVMPRSATQKIVGECKPLSQQLQSSFKLAEGARLQSRLPYTTQIILVGRCDLQFYWNGVSSSQLITANTVDIPAESTADVQIVKSGLTVGEHKVWVAFEYADSGEQIFFSEIIVSGSGLGSNYNFNQPVDVQSGDDVNLN